MEAEGKMNDFSTLDILLRRRYVIGKAAVDKATAAP